MVMMASGAYRGRWRWPLRRGCEDAGQLLARGDGELLVGVGEMPFDGPGGHEQVLGDFAVGQAGGGELGDAALAGRQRVEPAEDEPPGPPAGGEEFGAGPLGQLDRPAAVGEVECNPEDFAALCSLSRATQGSSQVGHGTGVFQSRAGALEHAYRLAEQLDAAPSALGQAGRPQRDPERARALEGLGERDLFARLRISAPSVAPWRSDAALAHLALGARAEARALAAEEVTLARAFKGPRTLGVALRAAGLTDGGRRGIELLRQAERVLEGSGARDNEQKAAKSSGPRSTSPTAAGRSR